MRTAFIGLGVMGYPMAGYLASNGHDVVVYNRTSAKAERWCEQHGGQLADSPAAAADGADLVFSCVGNDDDVREVMLGKEGILEGVPAGSIVVDHTTASASIAREVAKLMRTKPRPGSPKAAPLLRATRARSRKKR